MQKNNATKNRESSYNPNRSCYLTTDGQKYCYEVWDAEAKRTVTIELEVGKDVSVEIAAFLDASDHAHDLNDRYESELRDPLFAAKVNRFKAEPGNEDEVNPWDTLADKRSSVEAVLFPEPEPENPEIVLVRRVIDEECTEAQQDLIFRHFGMCQQLETIRQAEARQTGKLPPSSRMTKRKNKILDKVARALGVQRAKRRCDNKKR